jgi:iron(II)-dependent oxidoreductase
MSLVSELLEARRRTRAVADDLGGEREFGPRLAIVNPPRWELGHVGWFQEYWCLRRIAPGRYAAGRGASILPNADALYNSATVPHDSRWSLRMPEFPETLKYRDRVLEEVLARLQARCDEDDAYFVRLAVRHEDMHGEAFHYTRQTLGYPAPALEAREHPAGERVAGDAEIPGGVLALGAPHDAAFAFDNEKWSHPVVVRPFRIARAAVSNAEYREYVEAGGDPPRYWKKMEGEWRQRRFDRWLPLADDEPVIHVSWHEAQAYCRWAKRRLPTEAEWEFAAEGIPARTPERANLANASLASVHAYPAGDSRWGVRQLIGNVWEWTDTPFLPYPGFLRDPYKEYSEPWFGTHKVLRGGAFATSPRIGHPTYRNFFTPERGDIFAGLRTCALE